VILFVALRRPSSSHYYLPRSRLSPPLHHRTVTLVDCCYTWDGGLSTCSTSACYLVTDFVVAIHSSAATAHHTHRCSSVVTVHVVTLRTVADRYVPLHLAPHHSLPVCLLLPHRYLPHCTALGQLPRTCTALFYHFVTGCSAHFLVRSPVFTATPLSCFLRGFLRCSGCRALLLFLRSACGLHGYCRRRTRTARYAHFSCTAAALPVFCRTVDSASRCLFLFLLTCLPSPRCYRCLHLLLARRSPATVKPAFLRFARGCGHLGSRSACGFAHCTMHACLPLHRSTTLFAHAATTPSFLRPLLVVYSLHTTAVWIHRLPFSAHCYLVDFSSRCWTTVRCCVPLHLRLPYGGSFTATAAPRDVGSAVFTRWDLLLPVPATTYPSAFPAAHHAFRTTTPHCPRLPCCGWCIVRGWVALAGVQLLRTLHLHARCRYYALPC